MGMLHLKKGGVLFKHYDSKGAFKRVKCIFYSFFTILIFVMKCHSFKSVEDSSRLLVS